MSNLRNYIFESAQNAYDDVNEEQMFEEMSISEQMFKVYEDNLHELAPLLAMGTQRLSKNYLSAIANNKFDNVSRPKMFKGPGLPAKRNTFKAGKRFAKRPINRVGRGTMKRPVRFGASGRTR